MSERSSRGSEFYFVDANGERRDDALWRGLLSDIERDENGVTWLLGAERCLELGATWETIVALCGPPPVGVTWRG